MAVFFVVSFEKESLVYEDFVRLSKEGEFLTRHFILLDALRKKNRVLHSGRFFSPIRDAVKISPQSRRSGTTAR